MRQFPLTRIRRATAMAISPMVCLIVAAELTQVSAGVLPWITLTAGVAVLLGLRAAWRGARVLRTSGLTARATVPHRELATARHLVERYGEDSIAPFIIRPDKSYEFVSDGVLAYRVFGNTAVISGDPVGPEGAAPAVLASFLTRARSHGWDVVIYGASAKHLDAYRRLGLRSIRVGEEAVVCPRRFTLEGRRVRKLRQSVHRVQRRGWQISSADGSSMDTKIEAELGALEAQWRKRQPRMRGYAMSMGHFAGGIEPGDLYLLARSPDGTLAAAMRFIGHRGKLSLDTMRRVGVTPNGLNEALVAHALEIARERGVSEVSLNYAGLAHLVRRTPQDGWATRAAARLIKAALGRHFQMERLVRFNEKFHPEWRPRYLVYRSRLALPRAVFRILQAEGYVASRTSAEAAPSAVAAPRPRAGFLPIEDAPGS